MTEVGFEPTPPKRLDAETSEQLRTELNEIRQTLTESEHSFFRRVISTYYKSRGTETVDTVQKNDIKYYFLKGLRNQTVANLDPLFQTFRKFTGQSIPDSGEQIDFALC